MKKNVVVIFFAVLFVLLIGDLFAQKEVVLTNKNYSVTLTDTDGILKNIIAHYSHIREVATGYDLNIVLKKQTKEFRTLVRKRGEHYVEKERFLTTRKDPFTKMPIWETREKRIYVNQDQYKTESYPVYLLSILRNDSTTILDNSECTSTEQVAGILSTWLSPTVRIKLNTEDVLNNVALYEQLLKAGQDVNARIGTMQETMLIAAVKRNDGVAVERLIEKGADVNVADASGWSPYFFAVAAGNENLTQLLVKKGANTAHKDKEGNTVTVAQAKYNTGKLVEAVKNNSIESMRYYLNKNADVYQTSNDGIYPLDQICRSGSPAMLTLLLDYGFDPGKGKGYSTNTSALIPLYMRTNYEGMEELLKRGYALFKGNTDKESVVDVALKDGNVKIITMLREYGAKAANADIVSILTLAKKGHTDLAKSLMAEAKPSMERVFFTLHEWAPKEFIYWVLENMPFDIPKAEIASFAFCLENAKKNPDPSLYTDLTSNLDVIQKYSQKVYIGEKCALIARTVFESKDAKKINQLLQISQFINYPLYNPRYLQEEDKENTWYKQISDFRKKNFGDYGGQELRLIHLAAYYGNNDVLQKIIAKDPASVTVSDSKKTGLTPLEYAILGGNMTTVRLLLDKAVLAQKTGTYDPSSLAVRLAFESKKQDIIDVVVSKVSSMQTLLKSAILSDNGDLVRSAIEKGADPLIAVSSDRDALELARDMGKWKAADVLLEMKGAAFSMFKPDKVKLIMHKFIDADVAVIRKVIELAVPDLYAQDYYTEPKDPIWHWYNAKLLTDDILTLFLQKGADPTVKYPRFGVFEEWCKKNANDKNARDKEKFKKWYDIIQAHKKKK